MSNQALFIQARAEIEAYAQTLCETLEENYKQDSISSYKRMEITEGRSDYATKRLQEIENGTANLYKFVIKKGRKYLKIINQQFDTFQDRNEYRDGSVHAFIDRETGDVYKPAGYNKPAKHVRYNLLERSDRDFLFDYKNVGWAGGYLYMR